MRNWISGLAGAAALCAFGMPVAAQTVILTVTAPFAGYRIGDQISDPGTVAAILAGSNAGKVVKVGSGAIPTVSPSGAVLPNFVTSTDASANAPTLPVIGAGFSSAPYAGYVLVQTIPASAARLNIEIDNVSGSQIAVMRDDGTAATGAAPVNASVFPLAPGSGVGAQGGSWSSSTFKGRVQIYAPSAAAVVTVMLD